MREKELRLALVCYGGISLAVYMHGITKEIWRLARASQGFHAGTTPSPGSESVYHALLAEIADETGVRLRALVDILAGASAGGINAIFLAQAISTGQSLDPLTDLWLDTADIEALVDPKQAPGSRFSKMWAFPIVWYAAQQSGSTVDEAVEAGARDEVRAKLSHFIRSRWFEPPFGGERFLNLIIDAFDAMTVAPRGPRLLPEGQPLDLFVTVTDFRGHPERLTLNSPPEVVETEHRLVVPFTDHGLAVDSLAHTAELAFAARSTSSFPGAFPPFMLGELDRVLADRAVSWPSRADFIARVLPRQAAANAAESAVLIDGSVLANAPFRPAIEALRERPARRQVDRRFVYIDPFPGLNFSFGGSGTKPPGFFQTIIGAVSELPRQQPIRDNLDEIAERSRRIERMRAITEAIRPEVERQIEALFGYTLFLDYPTPQRLAAWRTRAQSAAAKEAGYGYAAYGHLKISGVIETIVSLLCHAGGEPEPHRWTRIRADIVAAVRGRGFDVATTFASGASAETIAFLRTFDLGFRIRRLRLLARRVSAMEADTTDTTLIAVREAVYASLADYLDCQRTEHHAHLRKEVRLLRGDAGPLLDALAESLNLKTLDTDTDARLAEALGNASREVKRPLLLAYLGFPFFDVATLPLLQGEGLDEFDPIKVDRIAPDDATGIRSGVAEATLKGVQFNTFGAFFSRAYRENDYLWGRLHGAERMIDITVSTLDGKARLKPGRVAAIKRAAFHAILDEEEARLTGIAPLIASLRLEIG
ncbi:patatin-like protein [Sphingomonas immobilis]|uniref:Patatin-like protein n=1 Tax=Sphingomonas immobilis TaxID=3063997 RepID=A0ABT8ZYJ6_9SPHN|nr:patatin-like protein [Sphingomonas sp. CA1-15]MDO7842655.1 patatin-like protein [Sphingomonas sp. CA1-15]